MEKKKNILGKLKDLIEEWYDQEKDKVIIPGQRKIRIGGPVFDSNETFRVLKSLLSGIITQGSEVRSFEKNFAKYCEAKYGISVNSGSSANLIALTVFSNKMFGERRITFEDEVIVPASTFPTTASPIIQINAIPVFVDVDLETFNIIPEEIEKNLTDKTKAIMLVHYFGHPVDMNPIMEIAEKHNLFVIEDACEAHGAKYKGKKVGGLADMGTFSFYVAHHMTTSEGGMIVTNNFEISNLCRSLKAFGRACVCDICKMIQDPTYVCPLRVKSEDPILKRYDIRYIFQNLGYSVKMMELEAAFGNEQLKKLDEFIKIRRRNAKILNKMLNSYSHLLKSQIKQKWAYHSYYSYPFLITEEAKFNRNEIVNYLENKNIETRPIFGGNLPDQPAFRDQKIKVGNVPNAIKIRDNGFFVGCYPGITKKEMEYVGNTIIEFLESHRK